MEKDLTIAKLKESLEKDYGDDGRTQYVIEKLRKDLELPKSDQLYIERMIKLCESVIEEPKKIPVILPSSDLVKCYQCNLNIKLDQKAVRENDFWFHDKCFEKVSIVKTDVTQKTQVAQKMKVQPKVITQHVIIKSRSTYPQMVFSGGLLASLVGTTYLLAGETLTSIVGIWGSILYYTIFKSHTPKKKQVYQL